MTAAFNTSAYRYPTLPCRPLLPPSAVCELMPVEEATDEQLLAAHSPGLVTAIDALGPDTAFPEQLAIAGVGVFLESDSLGNRRTARAARLAAGAAAGMAARLARGEADAGFALVRPAGERRRLAGWQACETQTRTELVMAAAAPTASQAPHSACSNPTAPHRAICRPPDLLRAPPSPLLPNLTTHKHPHPSQP